jgi:ssDNA-binding Zn-finger/Zn-ribbon topoisomerase 1
MRSEVTCLDCKRGHYVKRHRRSDGHAFYGCSCYPTCKSTLEAVCIDAVTGQLADDFVVLTSIPHPAARENAIMAIVRGQCTYKRRKRRKTLTDAEVATVRAIAKATKRPRSEFVWNERRSVASYPLYLEPFSFRTYDTGDYATNRLLRQMDGFGFNWLIR